MSQRLKIKFRALIPMEGGVMESGELWIEDGRIREVSADPLSVPGGGVLDLSDHLLMPGFVNAHCHLVLSALRGQLTRTDRFTDWVRSLLALNAEVPWEERVRTLRAGAMEMVKSGVTGLADYMPQPELLAEFAAFPFRQVLFLETLGFQESRVQGTLEKVKSVLDSMNPRSELLIVGLAPHAPYSVSPTLFRELKQLAVRYGCPLSCHVAEFAEEERFLQEGGGELQEFLEDRGVYDPRWKPPGMRPIPYLDSLGVLDNLVAVHLNSINQDLDLLASRKVSAVFCPRSTRWFGRQEWMPVRQMLDRGIPVALGTDSLASNDSLNFLEELKVAEKMLADVSRPELLEMATRGGAQALGLNSGTVVPGAFADLIGFQIAAPPEAWSDVPFEPDRREVDFAMVGGDRVF